MEEDPTSYIVQVLNSTSSSGMAQTGIRPFARRQRSRKRIPTAACGDVLRGDGGCGGQRSPKPSATAVHCPGIRRMGSETTNIQQSLTKLSTHGQLAVYLRQIPKCRTKYISTTTMSLNALDPAVTVDPPLLTGPQPFQKNTMRGPQKHLLSLSWAFASTRSTTHSSLVRKVSIFRIPILGNERHFNSLCSSFLYSSKLGAWSFVH